MIHEKKLYSLTCDRCHISLCSEWFSNKEDLRHHALARDWHSRLKPGYSFDEYNYYCPKCSRELKLDI